MDDILLTKYAQELLSNLLAIYEKTFDSLAAEIISTVTTLLQSIFSVPIAAVTATTSYGVKGDFAIKSIRPYQEFKDGCEEITFYENNVSKRNKSTGQDYIRWFEPFVNVAMKRYTVTARDTSQSDFQCIAISIHSNIILLYSCNIMICIPGHSKS